MEEKWYKSRRIWSALLTFIVISSMGAYPDQYVLISQLGLSIAAMLGLNSWIMPKK